jgi:hypothetical protein
VNFLELGRGEVGFWVAVEDLEFVGEFELFEKPEDALGARLFEPGSRKVSSESIEVKGDANEG